MQNDWHTLYKCKVYIFISETIYIIKGLWFHLIPFFSISCPYIDRDIQNKVVESARRHGRKYAQLNFSTPLKFSYSTPYYCFISPRLPPSLPTVCSQQQFSLVASRAFHLPRRELQRIRATLHDVEYNPHRTRSPGVSIPLPHTLSLLLLGPSLFCHDHPPPCLFVYLSYFICHPLFIIRSHFNLSKRAFSFLLFYFIFFFTLSHARQRRGFVVILLELKLISPFYRKTRK